MEAPRQPHAALLSSPGMGHRIPVLELAKRLVANHAFRTTLFLVPMTPNTSTEELQLFRLAATSPYNDLLHIVELPPVDISGLLPSDAAPFTQLIAMMREACVASFRSYISSMEAPPTVIIADFFGFDAIEVGRELGVPTYLYFPSSAWSFVLASYIPILDEEVEGEYVAQKGPLPLPGCRPVRPEDVVSVMMDRSAQQYREFVRIGVSVSKADGILLNTWDELEPSTLRALTDDDILRRVVQVPVYPVGPLVRPVERAGLKNEVLEWLDEKPTESVIFVSFGSFGTLSVDQMEETAWGLERSEQRFVWVVRPPIGSDGREGPLGYLPEGFLTRTHEVGLVVTGWAPQCEILAHSSVGGFLSHCGWNSTLESITSGVPMIAWPLFAEQKLNATLLTEELGIAVRPEGFPPRLEETTAVVVGREEIEKVVRKVMEKDSDEGKAMRNRVLELKCSATKALSKGGGSYNKLCEFVDKCRVGFVDITK